MANDSFIREVDEELRSDRMRDAWRRFGPYVIGGAVAIVLLVAVNEGWAWWQKTTAANASDQLYTALELAEAGDTDAAMTALDTVEAEGSGGYPTLARFREASLLGKEGRTDEAVAAYDAIATEVSDKNLRELALVLAAYQLIDAGDVSGVESRVGSLTTPDDTMRHSAREAIGLVKYRAGDLDGAEAAFESAIEDPALSQEARNRIQIYLAQLVAEGAGAPPAPEPAAAAEEPTAEAPASEEPAATEESATAEPAATEEAVETEAPAAAAPEAEEPVAEDTAPAAEEADATEPAEAPAAESTDAEAIPADDSPATTGN